MLVLTEIVYCNVHTTINIESSLALKLQSASL